MDLATFWAQVEASIDPASSVLKQQEYFDLQLKKLSLEDFSDFLRAYWTFHRKAYRNDLWAVAYVVMGGCSDNCFTDFRTWLVMRGQAVYQCALQRPDSLCEEFDTIPCGEIPLMEYYFYARYDEMFGRGAADRLYDEQQLQPQEPRDLENQLDAEPDFSRLCPRVYKRFWGNTRF